MSKSKDIKPEEIDETTVEHEDLATHQENRNATPHGRWGGLSPARRPRRVRNGAR
jgi:hypothetical protein